MGDTLQCTTNADNETHSQHIKTHYVEIKCGKITMYAYKSITFPQAGKQYFHILFEANLHSTTSPIHQKP